MVAFECSKIRKDGDWSPAHDALLIFILIISCVVFIKSYNIVFPEKGKLAVASKDDIVPFFENQSGGEKVDPLVPQVSHHSIYLLKAKGGNS